MQTQFEEYRATSEFMFNSEIAKMEDEITSLRLRYEQEILYLFKYFCDLFQIYILIWF